MKITTGKYRSRNIRMPKGIRPTQEKVRKAIFDILGDIEGLTFLELFSGSGAVGFEALSRGASELYLVEQNSDCLFTIKYNIEALKALNCLVWPLDADKAIVKFHADKKQFDIIFLDPPYCMGDLATPGHKGLAGVPLSAAKKTLQTLDACDILPPNGFIIVQHFRKDSLPDNLGVLSLFRQSSYGDTMLSFYRKG